MHRGLYEQLLTRGLARQLRELPPDVRHELRTVDTAEAPALLARHLARALGRALASLDEGQVTAANHILQHLLGEEEPDLIEEEVRELLCVWPAGLTQPPERPSVPLTATDLLVNARGEHRIGSEILKELQSADRVDLLCSFLKWSGYVLVRDALEALVARGGRLRVLTTCYLGATDARVLDELTHLGAVKVSYDARRTRLHAKAWLFHRDSGFSTAYIGSSNLSSAALVDGLEWNVRLAQTESPRVLEKFQGTFEAYWEDGEFEPYNREYFVEATRKETGSEPQRYLLEVRPYPFQTEILERLETERTVHGRWRNLVVAATGTGKTVMAALDYRRLRRAWGRARLLFVAHRREILEQSLLTFRQVLQDGSFGEEWSGRSHPTQDQHLFASVQKLAQTDLPAPDHFDVVIIDEFHHAEAPTYRRLLEHFRPRLLLGLTATPERGDGQPITTWFDGHVAAELRVWDALQRGLLAPFHYFGLHDNTDLRSLRWQRGRYDAAELEAVYTGNDARAMLVLKQVRAHVSDPARMRCLGFCAGVAHARFMADRFAEAGLAAVAVLGDTREEERREALRGLREGKVQAIFTVDVFNEGVDVPEVDTVLLLRPTESATIFLQQLGRGLRLAEGKASLTVLDFIGMARAEFRFDVVYRGLLPGTRRELVTEVEGGFPSLPSGCSMQLDRVAAGVVLDNLKSQLRSTRTFLRRELREVGPSASLAEFLTRAGVELEDIYRGDSPGWGQLRREVDFPTAEGDSRGLRSVSRLVHADSLEQLRWTREHLEGRPPVGTRDERMAAMLAACLPDLSPLVREEMLSLLPVLEARVDHQDHPLEEHPHVPLRVHCHYSLAEILAAFAVPYRVREGVYHDPTSGCDLLFVTIQKSERDYSPSTLYRDYALSPTLFHWESQSTTRADSPTGKRYQTHRLDGPHALLFVREGRQDTRGLTSPYLFLGPAAYASHEGSRPMAITWQLRWPIPMQFYRGLRLAA